MAQQTHTWVMPAVAATIWLFGLVMLGTRWQGVESAPGVWTDAVSLQRWVLFWAGLFVGAGLVAPWMPRWRHRILALLPLLAWLAVELRHGSLAPVAWLVYATPTAGLWLLGLLAGDRIGGPLARSVKRSGA
ncbi:MAG TPA: hypothetical protein VMF13_15920 [Luteitalea sp.]|nr:hypothetical protein [Luteitalea sp.]